MKNSLKTILPMIALLIFVLAGCASADRTKEQLSEHYKEHQDYESLVALMPYLNATMTRSDIEDLLGEPVHCPGATSCYYTTDTSVTVFCRETETLSCKESTLTLTIGYILAEKNKVSSQDTLASFALAPIGN